MGRRFRVVLELTTNFSGEPDEAFEKKTVKDYLESMKGVGELEVLSVEDAAVVHRPASRASWTPEAPTVKGKRKSRA